MLRLEKWTASQNRKTVLKDIQLSVHQGEILALLGPAGAGKTILLKTIAGLHPNQRGRIWLNGMDITAQSAHRRNVVMVFREALLFPHMTVAENVDYGLRFRKLPPDERKNMVHNALAWFGMAEMSNRMPSELTTDQQRRVSLARALVLQPDLLLLDEPMSDLEPWLRQDLRILLKELLYKLGMTVIYSTRDREEAVRLADRIAILHQGRILQEGTARQLVDKPVAPDVAKWMGSAVLIRGVWRKRVWETDVGSFPVAMFPRSFPEGTIVSGAIYPRDLQAAGWSQPIGERTLRLEGKWVLSADTGREYLHHIQLDNGVKVSISSRRPLERTESGRVALLVEADCIPLFADEKHLL
ncbi:ABC transporter ATP-binding protein [Polycladomyces subterraneus]|uniref:ABC transporter ATP-binding protein n=1 Tax=Polycladomyces subterraneus TaxID=1016997 RepID=A0ABT8ILK8_9BACL|nr:ABC transporter ATP-binding protein [Polycladomyces subterraneus]MDN4593675.1 ABC transporter ATP-binding protein [Polycladomyces subterraneus]